MKYVIFGAKSVALGTYCAMQKLCPDKQVEAFLVSSKIGNPDSLAGLPVLECAAYADRDVCVLVATPENIHNDIINTLEECGFHNHICITSQLEAELMEKYYTQEKIFGSIHSLKPHKSVPGEAEVYVAKFYKDKALKNVYQSPNWQMPIQVGAELTDVRITDICDNVGENISAKNPNYCELTALYWMWKNCLCQTDHNKYYGLFHYRRILDVSDGDLAKMAGDDVDVILPYPMMCEPDIKEHHQRYVKEDDWQAMLTVLRKLRPEYAAAYEDIFSKPYMYNYNMIIAKRKVLADYCAWLFPVLERTEELSNPKGWERKDRYIGYLGENLLTLYFMYHQKDLKIRHTGRILLV